MFFSQNLTMKTELSRFLNDIYKLLYDVFCSAVGTGRCLWAPSPGLYSMGQNMAYNVGGLGVSFGYLMNLI
jgi:hypothetical protein